MKRVVFLTGTRADFGKLKSLIQITQDSKNIEAYIFATGMHLNETYGRTVDEIIKCGFENIYCYENHSKGNNMDIILSSTINGFSEYLKKIKPDMVIVHGDRVEALAGAIVGSLNNTLVSHIEGGEISGTIDELIRHSVSKLSHLHFVANHKAKERLKQLGELDSLIHVIGSPDLDLMNSNKLPDISKAKQYYGVDYESYAIAMYHPVTTEIEKIEDNVTNYINALCESNLNYIVIYPNNDLGSKLIIDAINKNKDNQKMKIFPSLRFEYFLTLLKNANFIIGNSSAGVREAPYYGIKTIDVGTRQNNRSSAETIINCGDTKNEIIDAIRSVSKNTKSNVSKNYSEFGSGQSDKKFIEILDSKTIWETPCQKQFQDIN